MWWKAWYFKWIVLLSYIKQLLVLASSFSMYWYLKINHVEINQYAMYQIFRMFLKKIYTPWGYCKHGFHSYAYIVMRYIYYHLKQQSGNIFKSMLNQFNIKWTRTQSLARFLLLGRKWLQQQACTRHSTGYNYTTKFECC